jgi:serine/threonine protein kinase
MGPSAAQHPTREDLDGFALGKLLPDLAARIERHLGECTACRTVVEHMPGARPVTLRKKSDAGGTSSAQATTPPVQGLVTRSYLSAPTPSIDPTKLPPALRDHPRYRIIRPLGQGGMGVVYQAEHRVMERMVAVKVINRALMNHPDVAERFNREVRAAAMLDHPNIVKAYDAEQVGDLQLLAMEFVEGQSLGDYVHKKGPLPITHACHYVRQAALGLQHAHEKNMVHRDLKPQNLMRTPRGIVKILDFGLAKLFSENRAEAGLTQENVVMGTPWYLAPEQAENTRTADIRADIYSLGCTLFCLLTGQPPFTGDDPIQVIIAHLQEAPPPIETLRPDIPPELSALVTRMLAKKPSDRPQTPKDVAEALLVFTKPSPKPPNGPLPCTVKKTFVNRSAPTRGSALMGRRRLILSTVVAGIAVIVSGLWASGVFRVKTPLGTIVLTVDEPGANILVDGQNKITVTGADKEPIRVEVVEGEHELTVTKGGFVTQTRNFVVKKGEAVTLRVSLEAEPHAKIPETSDRGEMKTHEGIALPVKGPEATKSPPRGRWIQLDENTPDTTSWDWGKPLKNAENKKWENGVLSIDNAAIAFNSIQARDVSFRAQVKFIEGNNMALVVRSKHGKGGIYALFDKLDNGKMYIAILKTKNSKVVDLKGGFFEFRVTAIGNRVTIQVNGETVVEHYESEKLNVGHVEVTAYNARGMFKDIEVKILDGVATTDPVVTAPPVEQQRVVKSPAAPPTAAASKFVSLFNGKDLAGWEPYPGGEAKWTVEQGDLVGRGGRGLLFSRRGDYADFHVRAEAKVSSGDNSGIFFRLPYTTDSNAGYEAQIDAGNDPFTTGSLYGLVKATKPPPRANVWFTMEVIAHGAHIQILVDGLKTVDYTDPKPRSRMGFFALQRLPRGQEIRFRKMEVMELK